MHYVWKSQKKSHSIWVDKSYRKMPKIVTLVKQCYQTCHFQWDKNCWKMPILKNSSETFWVIFKQCAYYCFFGILEKDFVDLVHLLQKKRVPLSVARLDLALGALMTSKTSYITVVEWLMTFLAFWQCNTSNCKFAITKDGISVSLTNKSLDVV